MLASKLLSFKKSIQLALFILVFLPSVVFGATKTWDGGGSDNNWSTALNWAGGVAPTSGDTVVFDSTSTKNCTIDVNISIVGISINSGYTGTITQASGKTITIGSGSFTQNDGTFSGGDSAITINSLFDLNGGTFTSTSGLLTSNTTSNTNIFDLATAAAFNHNSGSVKFTGGNHFSIDTHSSSLYNVEINKCGTCGSSGRLDVDGDLTLSSASYTSMDITLAGNLSGSATMHHSGSGKITFDGTGDQTSTFTGRLPNVTVNKSSGTLTFSNDFAISNKFTYVAGSVVFTGTTVSFTYGDHWSIDSGSVEFNNVVVDKCATCDMTITGTMKVGGNFTLTQNQAFNSGTIEIKGNLTSNDSASSGSAAITLTGTNDQVVTVGTNDLPNGTFTINKASGKVSLGANLTLNGTGQDLTVTSGTLDVAGYNLSVTDVITITDKLKLKGNETFTYTTFSLNTSSSTVEYYDSAVTADLSKLPPSSFKNLILGASKTHNFETGSGNEITINGNISSNGTSSTKSVLRSLTTGTAWYLKVLGTESFSDNVDVKDSNASNGSAITAYYSTDSGNNTNWVFTPPSITWDGGGSTNNFSEAANWSTNTVPTATDKIVFNSTSVKNCTVNSSYTVKEIAIESGYNGTVSLGADLTVNGEFLTNNGTVSLNSYNLTLKGDLTVSATASFDAGTSTVTITEPGTSSANISLIGAINLRNMVLNLNGHLDIDSSVYLTGNLTYSKGYIDGGELKVEGNVTQGVSTNGGTGTLVFTGIWFQTLTGTGIRGVGELPDVEVNKPSGTLTLASVINTKNDWEHIEGTVAYGASELSFTGSSQYFNNAGMSINSLYVDISGGLYITGNLNVKGDLYVKNWSVLGGDLYVYGNVTTAVTSSSSTTGIVHFVGSNAQTFSGAGLNGYFTQVKVEKLSTATLTLADDVRVRGDFNVTSGLLSAGTSTITMVGTSATITSNGQSLYNLTLDTPGAITISGTLSILGSLNIKSADALSGSVIQLKKNLTLEDADFTGTAKTKIQMTGTDNATITKVSSGILDNGDIEIKKTGGASVTLAGNLTLNNGFLHNLTGVLDLDGYNLTTSSDVDVDDTLTLKGNETVTASAFTIDTSASKVIYKDSSVTAYLSNLPFSTFKHLTLGASKTHVFESGIGNAITINGSFLTNSTESTKAILRSDSTGTQWYVNATTATTFANKVDVKDSNASGGVQINAISSTNSGNNTNWDFTTMPAFAWTGAVDNNWNTAGNWGTSVVPGVNDVALFSSVYSNNNCTINASISVKGVSIDANYTGTITQGSGNTITIGSSDWIQSGGTFTGGSSAITFNGEFTLNAGTFTSTSGTLTSNTTFNGTVFRIYSGATFNHNSGLISFTGANHYNIYTAGQSLNNVSINKGGSSGSVGDMVVAGNLEILAAGTTSMAISLYGNLTGNTTNFAGGGEVKFVGSANQSITYTGQLPIIKIDKTGGTLSFDSNFTATNSIINLNGTVDPKTSTITLTTNHSTITPNGMEFYNIVWNRGNSADTTVTNEMVIRNDLTLTTGNQINTGPIVVKGNLTTTDSSVTGNAQLIFRGTVAQTATFNGNDIPNGLVTIDNSAGVTFIGTASINASGQDLNIKTGNLTLSGGGLVVADLLTLGAGNKLEIPSIYNVTAARTSIDSTSTIKYAAVTNGVNNTIDLNKFTQTFGNLEIDSSEIGDVYQFTKDTTVNAELKLDNATTKINHNTGVLTLKGNLNNVGGTFLSIGKVILSSTSQSISGSNTFYDLVKTEVLTSTLSFAAGTTQTITNSIELAGRPNNKLSLRSLTTGTQWNLTASATASYSNLDIKDSNKTGTAVNLDQTNVDSGNNTGWNFSTTNAYTWIGGTSSAWATASNWQGGVVPGANDIAIIDNNTSTYDPVISTTVSVGGLHLATNYTRTLTLNTGAVLTVGSHDLYVAGGTMDAANGQVNIDGSFVLTASATYSASSYRTYASGNWLNQGGSFIDNGGSVIFKGTGDQNFDTGGTTSTKDFNRIVLEKPSGTLYLLSSVKTLENFEVRGLSAIDVQTRAMTIGKDLIIYGTVTLLGNESITYAGVLTNQGTVNYVGTGTYSSLLLGNRYTTVTFKNGGTWTHTGDMYVDDGLYIEKNSTLISQAGKNIKTRRVWSNLGTYTANGSTVEFDGFISEIYGSTTFYNLKKYSKIKNDWIIFYIGVADVITINGHMEMYGLPDSVMWFNGYFRYIINMQGTYDIKYCQVRACNNIGSTITVDGTNVDIGYNINWVFNSAQDYTWTGATSTAWNTSTNWSGNAVPSTDDVAIITNGTNNPVISSNVSVRGITLASDFTGTLTQGATASVNLGRFGLHVAGGTYTGSAADLTIAGPFFQSGGTINDGSGTISVSGFTEKTGGTLTLDSGVFKLNGSDFEQNVTFGQVQTFKKLVINNTNNTLHFLNYGVTATDLEVKAGAKALFPLDSITTVTNFTVSGTSANYATLGGVHPGESWGLTVTGTQSVNYLKVSDSDASGGDLITASNSIDLSNNINWEFGGSSDIIITISPNKKPFKADLDVTISFTLAGTDGSGVTIFYTMDGTTPSNASIPYTGSFTIDDSFTIKAIGYANGNASSIFQKDYVKVDLAHLYARKTYGAGGIVYMGDTRRFMGQVWWMGENAEPDNMEYYDTDEWAPTFGGDDVRMPEFDDDIEWFCTGGTIVKFDTITQGGSALFTDDGYQTGYTVTLKIGPNSFTGCNNETPLKSVEDCEKCGDTSCLICKKNTDSNATTVPECEGKSAGDCANVTPESDAIAGGAENDGSGSGDSDIPSIASPIPIRTIGKKVEIHVAHDAGTFDLLPFTFGRTNRVSDFNELKVISATRVNILHVSRGSSGWFPYNKDGSGKYYRPGGDEAYVVYIGGKWVLTEKDGGTQTFENELETDHFRITERTDKNGNTITYDYQSSSYLLITDASGNEYRVYADTVIGGVNLIDKVETVPYGTFDIKTWTYEYDSNAYLTKERFEELYVGEGYGDYVWGYDHVGNKTKYVDYKGNITGYEYNSTWFMTKVILANGQVANTPNIGVNGFFTRKSIDPNGKTYTVEYDLQPYSVAVNRVIAPDGLVTDYNLDSFGRVTKQTQKLDADPANDIVTTFQYDSFHNITKTVVDPGGLSITTVNQFDSKGNITRNVDPNGVITDFLFDSNNRMTKQIKDVGGLAITDQYLYDSQGNKTKQIDPIGKFKVWEYDTFGRMTKAIDEIGGYEVCAYDSAGNKTRHVDRNGNITSYLYDELNRLTKKTDPAGYYETREYDGNSKLTRFTDKLGTATVYEYNSLNQVTKIAGDAGAPGCSCSGGSNVNGLEGIYEYAWNGKLTKFTDVEYIDSDGERGNFKFYEYDAIYRLTRTIIDPYGLALITETEYDTLGRVTKTRQVNYDGPDLINLTEYDKNSRIMNIKQVLGAEYLVTTFEFDQTYNITKETDPNGNFSQTFYDNVYRVTKTIDAENMTVVNMYNARSELTRIQVDPSGFNYITDTLYDDRGLVTKTIEPDGGIELCEYDANKNKTKCTDPNGGIRQWLFDNRNLLTKAIDEASNFASFEFDGLGNQTKIVNTEGTIFHFMYNDKSFLTKIVEDIGGFARTTEMFYDESTHRTKVLDPSGMISEIYFDAAYRATKTIADAGGKNLEIINSYDSLSRVTKAINQGGFESIIEYDQISRVTKQIMADGGEQTVIYDKVGNVLTKTIKVTNSTIISYSFAYDKIYQLTKSIEDTANLNITSIQNYDAVHRLTKITDAKSNTTSYFYDSENRITKTLFADSNAIFNEYDLKGRITKRTDQNLDVMTYLYDSRDLLTKMTYGSNGVQTFTWDTMRRKTQDTDNNSNNQLITMGYEFDKLSRMTKQTEKIGSGTTQNLIKLYDTFGHRTRITYAHGRNVDATFTALHQIDLIKTDVGSGIQTVANYDYLYDNGGSDKRPIVAKNTLHSGTDTRVDFAYDEMGRVTKKNWVDISASSTLVGFEYTYDLFGNRLTDNHLHSSTESETYYYDTAQRFTKYERGTIGGSPTFFQGYTLDDLANWTSFNNNGSTESRTHNSVNELTVRGSTNLTYDAKGNLTDDGNQKYVWDKLNRLIQVKDSGNNLIVDYYYNANNLRVEKHHAGGAKEQFYYDGASVIEETDGSQNLVREYVNGGQYIDEVILVANTVGASVTYNYYMTDIRYSVFGFIDSSGSVVERAKFDGYGKRTLMDASFSTITTPVVDQSYGYTGIRHDSETGLQYYRARYFDNDLGRFINRDPIGYFDGLNLYKGCFIPLDVDPKGKNEVAIAFAEWLAVDAATPDATDAVPVKYWIYAAIATGITVGVIINDIVSEPPSQVDTRPKEKVYELTGGKKNRRCKVTCPVQGSPPAHCPAKYIAIAPTCEIAWGIAHKMAGQDGCHCPKKGYGLKHCRKETA